MEGCTLIQMKRRAFLGSAICGVSTLAGCLSATAQPQTPRAYRVTWVFPGDRQIATLPVDSVNGVPVAQTLIRSQSEARQTFRSVEPFDSQYPHYTRLDYTDRFVGVTALHLPRDTSATLIESTLTDQTYSVTLGLQSSDTPREGEHWEYLLETWNLGETRPPETTELAITD